MNEPTEEQIETLVMRKKMQNLEKKSYPSENEIRRFWEWCGFTRHPSYTYYEAPFGKDNKVPCWVSPLGNTIEEGMPPIDLNNLFRYAAPKLIGDYKYSLGLETDVDYHTRESTYTFSFSNDPLVINSQVTDKDPALALFWAIYKLIEAAQ